MTDNDETKLFIVPFERDGKEFIAILEAFTETSADKLLINMSNDAIKEKIEAGRSDIKYGDVVELTRKNKEIILHIEEIK